MNTNTELVKTAEACRFLKISKETLLGYREFLIAGEDYFYGARPNSPILWNLSNVAQQINRMGLKSRQELKELREKNALARA